jgi:hypothetical protein
MCHVPCAVCQVIRHSTFNIRHSSFVIRHSSFIALIWTLALIFNAALTARDYFLDWPHGDYVRFWQQTAWTQAARAIDADPSTLPVAASGLSIHDLDPQTFDLLLRRRDVKVKWFDCRSAMLFPGGGPARYLEPDFFACDPELMARYLPDATVIARPRWPDSGNVIFTLYRADEFNPPAYDTTLPPPEDRRAYIGGENFSADDPARGLEPLALPIDLDGLQFVAWEMAREEWRPGETVELMTFWAVTAPPAPPLSLFIHLTQPDGVIVAQFDGLGVGVATLEPGDVFVQRHRIALPADAAPGPLRISLGAYHPDSGARLSAMVEERSVDAVVLGILVVE